MSASWPGIASTTRATILQIGQEIEVFVLNLDRQTSRIALSRKRLLSDPWDDARFRYHEGQLVEGLCDECGRLRAFVALEDGLKACCT